MTGGRGAASAVPPWAPPLRRSRPSAETRTDHLSQLSPKARLWLSSLVGKASGVADNLAGSLERKAPQGAGSAPATLGACPRSPPSALDQIDWTQSLQPVSVPAAGVCSLGWSCAPARQDPRRKPETPRACPESASSQVKRVSLRRGGAGGRVMRCGRGYFTCRAPCACPSASDPRNRLGIVWAPVAPTALPSLRLRL